MDCDFSGFNLRNWHEWGSNPYPFLLWIATSADEPLSPITTSCSNPYPFLLWIATYKMGYLWKEFICSNPYPFLLWIATISVGVRAKIPDKVVTLIHFYCGLRQLVASSTLIVSVE